MRAEIDQLLSLHKYEKPSHRRPPNPLWRRWPSSLATVELENYVAKLLYVSSLEKRVREHDHVLQNVDLSKVSVHIHEKTREAVDHAETTFDIEKVIGVLPPDVHNHYNLHDGHITSDDEEDSTQDQDEDQEDQLSEEEDQEREKWSEEDQIDQLSEEEGSEEEDQEREEGSEEESFDAHKEKEETVIATRPLTEVTKHLECARKEASHACHREGRSG